MAEAKASLEKLRRENIDEGMLRVMSEKMLKGPGAKAL